MSITSPDASFSENDFVGEIFLKFLPITIDALNETASSGSFQPLQVTFPIFLVPLFSALGKCQGAQADVQIPNHMVDQSTKKPPKPKTKWITSALAVFILRPQADLQIGTYLVIFMFTC